jgi:hypothetical protein
MKAESIVNNSFVKLRKLSSGLNFTGATINQVPAATPNQVPALANAWLASYKFCEFFCDDRKKYFKLG